MKLWVSIANKNSAEIDPAYIRRQINETFKLKLGDAIFPTGDGLLVPSAGSCFKCTKHSSCRQLLFEEIQEDNVCFDADCYKSKEKAHIDRLIEQYKSEGKEVKFLTAEYYSRNPLFLTNGKWKELSKEEPDSNTVGIIMEVPSWQQNKYRIGEVKRLEDFKEEDEQEEEEEIVEVIQEEGEEYENYLLRKKEAGKVVIKQDVFKLLNTSIMEEVVDFYQRGAFDISLLTNLVKLNIARTQFSDDDVLVKRLCELLGWEIKLSKNVDGEEIEDDISWKETIWAKIDSFGFNYEAIKDTYILVETISLLYRSWWNPELAVSRDKSFPDLGIRKMVSDLEAKFDIKLID